jgi:hypothetical protein
VRSLRVKIFDRRRYGRLEAWQLRHDMVDCRDDVGPGLLVDDQEDASLAIGPSGLLGVLRPRDRGADIAYTQGPVITICDDDVVPGFGLHQLIIGVDREGARCTVDRAFRAVDGRD